MIFRNLIVSSFITLTLLSCTKDNIQTYSQDGDVYVAGNVTGQGATYWKNGQAVDLRDSTGGGNAYSIYVSGSDIYVAGDVLVNAGGPSIASYWKNGSRTLLASGTNDSFATSVFVSGSDVYIAGNNAVGLSNNYIATCWKNGSSTPLAGSAQGSYASSVFVSGNDVYVAGYVAHNVGGNELNPIAAYWKNGAAVLLTDSTTSGNASSVFVNGGDVYVAGAIGTVQGEIVAYWKNGIPVSLATAGYGEATSIFVSGNDVYVAGYIQNGNDPLRAIYWKNGTAYPLPASSAFPLISAKFNASATSIFVSEAGDIYVSGWIDDGSLATLPGGTVHQGVSTFWKNGVEVSLGSVSGSSLASAIFVSGK